MHVLYYPPGKGTAGTYARTAYAAYGRTRRGGRPPGGGDARAPRLATASAMAALLLSIVGAVGAGVTLTELTFIADLNATALPFPCVALYPSLS